MFGQQAAVRSASYWCTATGRAGIAMKESDLYLPLKRFLEAQHYEVKGEVQDCDALAVRGNEAPVVVELKCSLNLDVVLQAVTRLSLTPNVYIGIPKQCKQLNRRRKPIIKLLRMLGLGLVVIDGGQEPGSVAVLLDPGEYKPRLSKQRVHGELLFRLRLAVRRDRGNTFPIGMLPGRRVYRALFQVVVHRVKHVRAGHCNNGGMPQACVPSRWHSRTRHDLKIRGDQPFHEGM